MRCTATCKSSGEQCLKRALAGATVCLSHGAGAPQVREAATRRKAEREEFDAVARIAARHRAERTYLKPYLEEAFWAETAWDSTELRDIARRMSEEARLLRIAAKHIDQQKKTKR